MQGPFTQSDLFRLWKEKGYNVSKDFIPVCNEVNGWTCYIASLDQFWNHCLPSVTNRFKMPPSFHEKFIPDHPVKPYFDFDSYTPSCSEPRSTPKRTPE
jgi:hypothetical protein